jgi:23S rRNA (uracil1939-C5)-methyltransferase
MSQFSLRIGVKKDSYLIQPVIGKLNILSGQKYYFENFKNRNVRISSPSFFQVNIGQAEKLGDLISKIASLKGDEIVIDAFAGVGTFSLLISSMVKKIYAIESSYSSIEDAKINLKNLSNVELIQNEVENLTEETFKEKIDIIILDPSRKGVHSNALKWVLKLSPPQIIYVSCNIESLKKDLIELKDCYEINKIMPLDMFPQTKHVECVVNLTRVSK